MVDDSDPGIQYSAGWSTCRMKSIIMAESIIRRLPTRRLPIPLMVRELK